MLIEALAGRPCIETVFWLLGAMMGSPVVQIFNGKVLVEVTDTGAKKRIGVGGFCINAVQPPHVDNSFNQTPPDHLNLLCCGPPARAG